MGNSTSMEVKWLQLDQWAPPFCSHWPTTSPPLIFPMWFGNGIEVHPVWESLSWCKFHQTIDTFHHKCISVLGKLHQTIDIVRCKCILVFEKFQHISVFLSLENFIRLFKLFVSIFRSLGNFRHKCIWCLGNFSTSRLVTFRSLGNFIRLVTVISLNCSQFM